MKEARNPTRSSEERIQELCAIPAWKNVLDLLFVLVTLPAWLPIMCFIAVGIKIVSRGPVFFRQQRIGFGNKPFTCFKFRSMKVDADTAVHSQHMNDLMARDVPMVKMDAVGDARLIRFGGLLRSTGLDELPQFINVMRREMSLVGPRPCTPSEYVQYSDWQRERFNTLPGLTGLWQVSGKNRTTFREMMTLDIRYARTKTLWMDLKIIFRTLPAIFVQVQDTQNAKKAVSSTQPVKTYSDREARRGSALKPANL